MKPAYFPVRNLDHIGRIQIDRTKGVAHIASVLGRAEAVAGWDEIRVGGAWCSISQGDLSERIYRGAKS